MIDLIYWSLRLNTVISTALYGFFIYPLVYSTIVLPFTYLFCNDYQRYKVSSFCQYNFARFNNYLMGVDINIINSNNVISNDPSIIISNHTSNMDIFALGDLPFPTKFVIKLSNLFIFPTIMYPAKWSGNIFVDRSNTERAIKSLKDSEEMIYNYKFNVIFFPEGTRNPKKDLLPFKKGAFEMARRLKIPIFPIYIEGSNKVWPLGTLFPYPGYINIHLLSFIDSSLNDIMDESTKILSNYNDMFGYIDTIYCYRSYKAYYNMLPSLMINIIIIFTLYCLYQYIC